MNKRSYGIRNTCTRGEGMQGTGSCINKFWTYYNHISNKSNISGIPVAQSACIIGTIPSHNCIFKSI